MKVNKSDEYKSGDVPEKFDEFIEWLQEKASAYKGEARESLEVCLDSGDWWDVTLSFDTSYEETDKEERDRKSQEIEGIKKDTERRECEIRALKEKLKELEASNCPQPKPPPSTEHEMEVRAEGNSASPIPKEGE